MCGRVFLHLLFLSSLQNPLYLSRVLIREGRRMASVLAVISLQAPLCPTPATMDTCWLGVSLGAAKIVGPGQAHCQAVEVGTARTMPV